MQESGGPWCDQSVPVQRGGSVIGITYCGVTVIQNIILSGRAFNKLSVFGEFMGENTFVKVAEDNN